MIFYSHGTALFLHGLSDRVPHESALYMHNLSDREPFSPVITVGRGYNAKHTVDITKETKLKDILAEYPWLKDELYKVNDKFKMLGTPVGKERPAGNPQAHFNIILR